MWVVKTLSNFHFLLLPLLLSRYSKVLAIVFFFSPHFSYACTFQTLFEQVDTLWISIIHYLLRWSRMCLSVHWTQRTWLCENHVAQIRWIYGHALMIAGENQNGVLNLELGRHNYYYCIAVTAIRKLKVCWLWFISLFDNNRKKKRGHWAELTVSPMISAIPNDVWNCWASLRAVFCVKTTLLIKNCYATTSHTLRPCW